MNSAGSPAGIDFCFLYDYGIGRVQHDCCFHYFYLPLYFIVCHAGQTFTILMGFYSVVKWNICTSVYTGEANPADVTFVAFTT
jgi:hypothetical protein